LKKERAGRATFLALDLIRQRRLPLAPDASGAAGFVGRAIDLVRCRPELRALIEHLLHDVVVVKTLSSAIELAGAQPGVTIVTVDGEIVRNGAISGGAGEGDTGPLARRAQIAALRVDLDAASGAVDRAV